ncbi:MAG: hypothetical protein E6980_11910 [Clostridium sp.]|uniref:plasmid mobilization protein n=1 Tax=Clostridium sp. TaxID=1506 RepID=UPI002901BF70|nr:hypothetical protein [Clostridium sp.]MDU1230856.1 hypothetical protein [Clostridium sp.]
MDTKLIIRLSIDEKEDLNIIAKQLNMTLSEYTRRKLMGRSLKSDYLNFICSEIYELEDGEIFSLKDILDIHWEYISKGDRKKLLEDVIELIDNDDIDIDIYRISEKGKYKFIKESSRI